MRSAETKTWLLAVSLIALVVGCDDQGRGYGPSGLGGGDNDEEPTLSEIEDSFDRVLADAAAHVGNQSNWVDGPDPEPDDDAPSEPPGDDGGSGDDGGAVPGTCAGLCGDVGSDGVCYCDSECEANGDCCDDFAGMCSSEEPPAGGTCSGHCGDQGSDGSCYCDETCTENGDCCDDYAAVCGAGLVVEDAFDLQGALAPQAGLADACWAVLTDPLDVNQVAQMAGAVGLAAGGTCVAVTVVPAGAAAAPTAGLSVGAAALACGAITVEGTVVGAVGSVLSQRLPSIVSCSNEVVNSVVRVFPWGTGASTVPVSVYSQNPGNCDPDRHSQLQNQVTTRCKNAGQRSCTNANVCETLGSKMQMASQCIGAREQVNDECFGGGDDGHNTAVEQERNLHANCLTLSTNLGC